MDTPVRLAAVVLTGGTGARLGGADKAFLEVDGRTLLEHALDATAAAEQVVVVGPPVPTSRPVQWTREDPPGGGPAAGVLAALDALVEPPVVEPPELVCLLAVDMPRVTRQTLARLVAVLQTAPAAEAACLADESGRLQWLAGVYRYAALAAARPDDRASEHGMSMRRLVGSLRTSGVSAVGDEAHDVDTWEDLARLSDRGDITE